MSDSPCAVTIEVDGRIVKGPLPEDKAIAIAKMLMGGMFQRESMQQPVAINNEGSRVRPAGKNSISPKQLENLEKNPKWEQKEICERYGVGSLNELTREQASAAIKASMDRKDKERRGIG